MNPSVTHKIRVLIVDDSIVSQQLFKGLLHSDNRFELVGIAENGLEAIEYVARFNPDVVSMDINMPKMNGIEATRTIMQQHPVPILIVSGLYNASMAEMAIEVLNAGAASIMPKPNGPGHPRFAQTAKQYLNLLKSMSEIKVVRRKHHNAKSGSEVDTYAKQDEATYAQLKNDYKIVLIGASAGGPEALKIILSNISQHIPVPVLIVQHIDAHFAEGYCKWLQSFSQIPVQMAEMNQELMPGVAYLAPGDKHLIVKSKGVANLSDDAPLKGLRPSIAHLFSSAARFYNNKIVGILLSGMGADGAEELKELKNLGALTLIQDQASCLVYGMPGAAASIDAAVKILPPHEIVSVINSVLTPSINKI